MPQSSSVFPEQTFPGNDPPLNTDYRRCSPYYDYVMKMLWLFTLRSWVQQWVNPRCVIWSSPMGAVLSALVSSCSSRYVKDTGFPRPASCCRLWDKEKGCVFIWHMGWTHLLLSSSCLSLSFSSAGEVFHSRLLCCFTLDLGTFQKEQENGAVKGWQCQYFHSRTDFAQREEI